MAVTARAEEKTVPKEIAKNEAQPQGVQMSPFKHIHVCV